MDRQQGDPDVEAATEPGVPAATSTPIEQSQDPQVFMMQALTQALNKMGVNGY